MTNYKSGLTVTGKRLAIALCVCTTLSAASTISSEPAEAQSNWSTFFNKGFNYCDAKLIAAYWGMSTDRAKSEASRKIQQGGLAVLKNEILPLGRQRASCRWQDTGHTYRDAEKLARYWGYNSPSEAKVKVASLYTRGLTGQVRRSLRAASAGNNNNGGGQIGVAISADAFSFKCKDGRRLNVNVVKDGNKRYAEATLGGQRSGRMPRVSKKKWANGRYKVRFRDDLARIDWKGTKMFCKSSN